MKIEVKNEDTQRLAQLLYLGNIVINGYRKSNEILNDYEELAQNVYSQILQTSPELEFIYQYKYMPNVKSLEARIADFSDRTYDSVLEYFQDFLNHIISDYIIDKIE